MTTKREIGLFTNSSYFDTEIKLMFDETVTEHLDIESIMFLSERLKELLCGDE